MRSPRTHKTQLEVKHYQMSQKSNVTFTKTKRSATPMEKKKKDQDSLISLLSLLTGLMYF